MSRMAPISAPYHLPVKSDEVNRKIPVKTPYHGFRLKSEQFDFGKKKDTIGKRISRVAE